MRKHIRTSAKVSLALIVGVSAFLLLTRTRPVLLRVPPDDTIRPRYYCILNPFRDTAPEKLAEQYLSKLRDGEIEAIYTLVGDNKYILEEERKWPIQKWRVANRTDKSDSVELSYWVTRGNGYPVLEEEAYLDVVNSASGWAVTRFSAVY